MVHWSIGPLVHWSIGQTFVGAVIRSSSGHFYMHDASTTSSDTKCSAPSPKGTILKPITFNPAQKKTSWFEPPVIFGRWQIICGVQKIKYLETQAGEHVYVILQLRRGFSVVLWAPCMYSTLNLYWDFTESLVSKSNLYHKQTFHRIKCEYKKLLKKLWQTECSHILILEYLLSQMFHQSWLFALYFCICLCICLHILICVFVSLISCPAYCLLWPLSV